VNVISRRMLKTFYESNPEYKKHATAFEDWFRLARKAYWQNFQDAKATFGQTDVAKGIQGRTATIFDIGGNKCRIVAHVDYARQTIKIEAVMDHREYDKKLWKKLF
jgi:mRNA interferase HigB